MTIKVLGIDLGKRYFHVHGVDINGKLVTRKKLNRKELLLFLSNLAPSLIGYSGSINRGSCRQQCSAVTDETRQMA